MSNDRFDKFTERARKVLSLAQEEATRFNHNYMGTEHLLLGLVREGEGVAAKVLTNLGVELNMVRSKVEFIIGRGDRMIVGEIGLTPRAKKVIELAVDEARRLGHHYIGTEHLLLGLIREGEGIAAGVLESLSVNLEKVRTQTIQILSQNSSAPGWTAASTAASVPGMRQQAPAGGGAWAYLIMVVAYPGIDRAGVVGQVYGGGDEARFGSDTTPVYQALATLGAEGWELVAVDTAMPDAGPAGTHYIFKRPA